MVGPSAQAQPYSEIDNRYNIYQPTAGYGVDNNYKNHTDMIIMNQQNIPFMNYLTSQNTNHIVKKTITNLLKIVIVSA
jgi:hypothetical protein